MRTLRILNIGQNYRITGGSDRYMFSLAKLLEGHGHTVIPFAARHEKNEKSDWGAYFPEAIDFDSPKASQIGKFIFSKAAADNLARLIEVARPDIAHLHIYYGKITSSILPVLRRYRIPVVQTLHEYKTVCPVYTLLRNNGAICTDCSVGNYWRAVVHRCNRSSMARSLLSGIESYVSHAYGAIDLVDQFLTVSDFQRELLVKKGLPAAKTQTLHNFMDCSEIVSSTEKGEYFLFVGRIEREKGIFTLLEAMKRITDTPLLIVGSGRAQDDVRRVIESQRLDHVKLLGFKSGVELSELIRKAICVVVPSEWYETFGLVAIESFAHGRPVLASRIGGLPEVVEDGVTGKLFEPGNVEELQESLGWFVENKCRSTQMGEAARLRLEVKFSPSSHFRALDGIYRNLLSDQS